MMTNGHDIAQKPWNGDFHDISVWNWAYQHRHYAMIRLLVTHSESKTLEKTHALQDAAKEDDIHLINALLEAPWLPEVSNKALQIASQRGHVEVVERLLEVLQ